MLGLHLASLDISHGQLHFPLSGVGSPELVYQCSGDLKSPDVTSNVVYVLPSLTQAEHVLRK